MRVLHVLNRVRDSGNGITNVAVDLALEQKRQGHDVRVASAGGDYVQLLSRYAIPHDHIDFTTRAPGALMRAYRRLTDVVRLHDTELVHAHTLTPTVLGFLACVGRRRRLVATVHNEYQRGVVLMGLAHRVVGVSDAVSAAMRRRRVPASRVITIANGVVGSLRRPPLPASDVAALPPNSIVTVGAVSARKGADVLVRAFELVVKQIPDAHLFWVGNIDWPEPVEFTRSKHWGEQVHFVGFDSAPQRYLSNASMFVLASRQDPFPLAVLEALAAGLPIIASDVDGIPEALGFGEAGLLVESSDPRALAESIVTVLRSEELRNRLARSAEVRARNYSVTAMADAYLLAYESLGRQ